MVPLQNIWSCTLEEDVEGIKELLSDEVSVNSRNSFGETSLHLAARYGLEVVTKVLLDAGADVHMCDWESGWTPLHRSLYFGHVRVSLLLLQAGALLDGGRGDELRSKFGKERKPGSRSRSESLVSYSSGPQRGGLCDHDGNTPLDVLSLELRPRLEEARKTDRGGDVYSFGKADFFLGYDSLGAVDVVRPRRIETLANLQVIRVAASRYHSAAVTCTGEIFTWGHGRGGRLGHGNEDVCMLPTLVQGLATHKVANVAASDTHTAALTADGALYTWGRDRFGQLGHGPGSRGRLAPKRVEGLRKTVIVAVATGTEHTVAATRLGACYTWGRNNHGQLGFDGASQTSSPRPVSHFAIGASRGATGAGRHVIQVSASAKSTVVVTRGVDKGSGLSPVNEVYQWGQGTAQPSRVNFNQSSGSGSSSRWQTHDARANITQVAAAKNHNLALSSAGQVFTWGFGADNLGLDPRETRTTQGPQLVAAMLPENCGGNAVYVSTSDRHSCVVTDTGDIFTWGTAGEGVGALDHGDRNWQPSAKRVPSLKKVSLVAAAPDHTLVLLQASLPTLPHAESLAGANGGGSKTAGGSQRPRAESLDIDEGSEDGEDVDPSTISDSDQTRETAIDDGKAGTVWFTSELPEPPTLKQHCEIVLAREVDLRNACTILAYADALDATALVKFCAEFVRTNLDGILLLGRVSDRDCILETSSSLACSMLGTREGKPRRVSSVTLAMGDAGAAGRASVEGDEEEGLNREAMATALARADVRAETPSATVAARAVRSLKKKIARISELEVMRDSGKHLTADQVSKVQQKPRMEAELGNLDSRLERAKFAQSVRALRLRAEGVVTEPGRESGMPDFKSSLLPDEKLSRPSVDSPRGENLHVRLTEGYSRVRQQVTPELDLSQECAKVSASHRFKCEACGVSCADGQMYADHLRGKKHRVRMAKMEQQLHDKAETPQPEASARTWANVSTPTPSPAGHVTASTSTKRGSPHTMRETEHIVRHERRASCPQPSKGRREPDRKCSNSTAGRSLGTMRLELEQQQQAATFLMGRDTRNDQPSQSTIMSALRSSHPLTSTSSSGAYSLTDFITTPGSKSSSHRNSRSDRENEGRIKRVWDTDQEGSAVDMANVARAKSEVSPSLDPSNVGGGLRTRKSFSEIIAEEEREKEERDAYGESVWFVSRKPRSTSFETIVREQRHAEEVAEKEKIREAEDEMEDEMLRLVLEMSRNDAQPIQSGSSSHKRSTRGGRKRSSFVGGEVESAGARQRKGAASKASRQDDPPGPNTTARADPGSEAGATGILGNSSRPATNGRNRRPKRHHNSPHLSNPSVAQGRVAMRLGTSAP